MCEMGDVLVVTKLDRLARSIVTSALCEPADGQGCVPAHPRRLDTAMANGRLMLNVLGSVAQFEREAMLERQREGIAKAKVEGKFKGRAPTARRKAEEIGAMAAAGMTRQVIAGKLGMSERSVYRVLATWTSHNVQLSTVHGRGAMAGWGDRRGRMMMTGIAFVLRIALIAVIALALVVVFVILGFAAYSIFLIAKWLIGLV
jgi:Resolvase, N terminal domain